MRLFRYPINAAEVLHFAAKPNINLVPIVNRDYSLVWLSIAWFAAVSGAAIWVLSLPANKIFEL